MRAWFRLIGVAAAIAALTAIALSAGPAAAAPRAIHAATRAGGPPTDISHACPAPPVGYAKCGAIRLLRPSRNWNPFGHSGKGKSGVTAAATTLPPGYYPGDLQSAYGLQNAVTTAAQDFATAWSSVTPPAQPALPTIAVVDAYDDQNAGIDLSTYRSTIGTATDSSTGQTGLGMPPLCNSSTAGGTASSDCVTFTKVDQTGGTNYPRGDKGWGEEISLDLDMASSVCPYCNITLVEATNSSFANLQAAVNYAKTIANVAVVTNSYGGSEFSGENSYNSTYSSTPTTAITVSTGDSGFGAEFPAAAPSITAVGGTSLTYNGGGSWSESVWSGAGAGCSAYENQPSWQNPFSQSSVCSMRQIGDIATVADPNTGVAVYDTFHDTGWMVFGGTSASAQIVGGMYGLAAFTGSEAPSPETLYTNGPYTGGGGNIVPVTSGNDGSCGSTYMCDATLSYNGYNGPTGLGTPFGIGAFLTTAPSPSFSLSASPSSATVAQGGQTSYTVTVNPSGGYTGSATLSVPNCPSNATCSFATNPVSAGGSTTLTVSTATGTPASAYNLTITGTDTQDSSVTNSTSVSLTVNALKTMTAALSVGAPTASGSSYQVPISVTATDVNSGSALSGALVILDVYKGTTCTGTPYATGSATTASNGQASFRFSTSLDPQYWCTQATVTDTGYASGLSNSGLFTT